MSDYISREALLAKQYEAEGHCGLSTKVVDVRDIEDEPAADVVEVVRCKDCIHWHESKNGYGDCYHIADRDCEGGASFDCSTEADDYCSHGSRMDGGEHHAE